MEKLHGLGIMLCCFLSYQHQHREFEALLEVECADRISLNELMYNGVSSLVADLWATHLSADWVTHLRFE